MRRFLGMALWMIGCGVCLAPAVAFWQSRDSGYNVSVGGGGAAPTWTPTGNPAAQNTNTSSVTYTGVAIGSPAASDVIVAVYSSTTTVASSVTCNGVAMTKQKEESTAISGLQIWSITASAAGVTGLATTTFVASASGNMGDEVIQVGKLTGVNATPPNTGFAATGTSIGVTVPATGFAIVGAVATSTGAVTWSGGAAGAACSGTCDFTTTTATSQVLYTLNATATGTVSETGQSSGSIHFLYAAWGP